MIPKNNRRPSCACQAVSRMRLSSLVCSVSALILGCCVEWNLRLLVQERQHVSCHHLLCLASPIQIYSRIKTNHWKDNEVQLSPHPHRIDLQLRCIILTRLLKQVITNICEFCFVRNLARVSSPVVWRYFRIWRHGCCSLFDVCHSE